MIEPHHLMESHQARAGSAWARRACALRALGLLLADGTPTVGGGRLFDGSTKFFYENCCNSGTERTSNVGMAQKGQKQG